MSLEKVYKKNFFLGSKKSWDITKFKLTKKDFNSIFKITGILHQEMNELLKGK
jgi:hypothetical protein